MQQQEQEPGLKMGLSFLRRRQAPLALLFLRLLGRQINGIVDMREKLLPRQSQVALKESALVLFAKRHLRPTIVGTGAAEPACTAALGAHQRPSGRGR